MFRLTRSSVCTERMIIVEQVPKKEEKNNIKKKGFDLKGVSKRWRKNLPVFLVLKD